MRSKPMLHQNASRICETVMIGVLACVFLMPAIVSKWNWGGGLPTCPDHWLTCFTLEHQITRILGKNPGGLWDGGYLFPFHRVSMLCNEPSWGVSLAVLPVWVILRDIFFIDTFMGIPALILGWIGIYWLARMLGCGRFYAFLAAMTFCLSGAGSLLIGDTYFFWPFFLIPVLTWLLIRMCGSAHPGWGIFLGITYGYLAWSSAHLAVMGGCFLAIFGCWWIWIHGLPEKNRFSVVCAVFVSVLIAGLLYVPMYIVHRQFGRGSLVSEQAHYATNLANLFFIHLQYERPFHPLNGFAFWKDFQLYTEGETPIGVPISVFLLALYFLLRLVYRPDKARKPAVPFIKTVLYYSLPVFLAVLNSAVLGLLLRSPASVDSARTVLYYCLFGFFAVYFRNRVMAALRTLPFFFFLCAAFMLSLAFGPYYDSGTGGFIPSPTLIISAVVPGFSGIRATARWGLMVSFCLSLGVFLSVSRPGKNIKQKIAAGAFCLLAFLELFPGFYFKKPLPLKLCQWKPRAVDVFLKDLPGKGAVLELVSYPIHFLSLGPEMYSSLYHTKPIVTGYATVTPEPIAYYVYNPDSGPLTPERMSELRKFGARYWVLHKDTWLKNGLFQPGEEIAGLTIIASLDEGKTYVYEDLKPRVSVSELP